MMKKKIILLINDSQKDGRSNLCQKSVSNPIFPFYFHQLTNNKRRKKNLSSLLRARLCENNEKEGKRDKFNFHPRCRLRARLGEGSGGDARCDGVSGPRWLPPRYRSKGTSSSTRIRTLVSYAREARSNDRTWRNTLDRNSWAPSVKWANERLLDDSQPGSVGTSNLPRPS